MEGLLYIFLFDKLAVLRLAELNFWTAHLCFRGSNFRNLFVDVVLYYKNLWLHGSMAPVFLLNSHFARTALQDSAGVL